MGRTYESTKTGNYPPKIRFTSQDEVFPKGTWFVGTKLGQKLGKEFKREKVVDGKAVEEMVANLVFTFRVHAMHDELHVDKKENKEWTPFPLEQDSEAELNGNSQLDDKIGQVAVGQKIRVTYNGKKMNPKTGRKFNDYTVVDEE